MIICINQYETHRNPTDWVKDLNKYFSKIKFKFCISEWCRLVTRDRQDSHIVWSHILNQFLKNHRNQNHKKDNSGNTTAQKDLYFFFLLETGYLLCNPACPQIVFLLQSPCLDYRCALCHPAKHTPYAVGENL